MRVTRRRGMLLRAVALATVAALTPVTALASDTATAAGKKSTQTSLQAAASRAAAAMAAKPAAVRHDQQTSSGTHGGFLRSTPGIIAIAVLGVGAGYAIYSAQHDRISSPGRK